MRTTAQTALLVLTSGLLGANLVATLGGGAPSGRALEVLPRAEAQQGQPLETDLRTGKTLVTATPQGDTIYVWTCRVINGVPSFEAQRYVAPR